jgi:hypothetical protein
MGENVRRWQTVSRTPDWLPFIFTDAFKFVAGRDVGSIVLGALADSLFELGQTFHTGVSKMLVQKIIF